MSESKTPDYRIFAFPKGGDPRTYEKNGKSHWLKDGQAWTHQNRDASKTYLRGDFKLAGTEPTYTFRAYPSRPTEADLATSRPPDYHLFFLDEHGRIPTKPDSKDPSKEVWQSACGLWLKRSKDDKSTYLRGTLKLGGQDVVLQIFHIRPEA